jgi:hypothetical protein
MLKTKRRKSPTLGGTVDHFANQFQGLEIHGPKKKRVWDISTSDP